MQPTGVNAGNGSTATLPAAITAVEPTSVAPPANWSLEAAPQPHILYDRSKRALDVLLASVLLVPALPVIAVASLGIVLTSGQSPLLVQRRTGYLGHEFPMLKLRTMRRGSGDEQALDVPEGQVFVAKAPNDPRVTPVGRLLRRTSIDELPQLLNVLAGHMSLVGPRPALPVEVSRYPTTWHRRLTVRPGLTGLWQVSGRSDVSPRRRTAIDIAYVQRRSLVLDMAVLLRTAAATVSMRGAW